MKKYKVTKKHPAYKEGLEIRGEVLIGSDSSDWEDIMEEQCQNWLNEGWLEEIQVPELNPNWIQKMILIDDILKMYNLDDIEVLKKILERA
jgi:hypothetical protein